MRTLLAAIVLLLGTANAGAAETLMWCSDGAQLLHAQEDNSWILRIDGKSDERLTGEHDIIGADLILYGDNSEQRQNDLVYARGRIFRPCKAKASDSEKAKAREAELESAIEKSRAETSRLQAAIDKIRTETAKSGQTLPKLRRAIGLIMKDLNR